MTLLGWMQRTNTSQADFAKRIGVSQSAISKYVLGQRTPRKRVILAIVEATGNKVTASDLLCGDSCAKSD